MDIRDPEGSYTQFLVRAATGSESDRAAMDWITGMALALAAAMSALMTVRERRSI
jgi:hypothetical protein